jgi:periplasmic protein TonB
MSAGAERWQGAFIVAGLHAAVLAALLAYQPSREALSASLPIMVSLITPVQPEQPKPKPVVKRTPAPKPVQPAPVPPLITAAPVIAPPLAYVAPPPPPVERVVEAPPPAPPQPAPVVASAPLPVIPPRFDAAYLENPPPAYPTLSRRLREHGKVVLRVLVTPQGAAERIELRASSGSQRLDGAALETVRRWRFVPARQGSEPVPAWVLVPISFSLEG